ncbi:MAG: hypothetical protein FDZ70_10390 [Actinobacteria bacterium]|nr:MAG: hypothetical protein FDZ70_10390 [Actinomycetota bacterium]
MNGRADIGSDVRTVVAARYQQARLIGGMVVAGAIAPIAFGAVLMGVSKGDFGSLPLAQLDPVVIRVLVYSMLLPDVTLAVVQRIRLLGAARRGEVTDLTSGLRVLANWSFVFALLVGVVALGSGMMYIASTLNSSEWRMIDLGAFLVGTAASWLLIVPNRREWVGLLHRWGVVPDRRASD